MRKFTIETIDESKPTVTWDNSEHHVKRNKQETFAVQLGKNLRSDYEIDNVNVTINPKFKSKAVPGRQNSWKWFLHDKNNVETGSEPEPIKFGATIKVVNSGTTFDADPTIVNQ